MNLVFKPPEHHGFVHLFTRINSFNDQVTEGIGNIDQASPWMSPLESSTKVECLLCFLENIEEDKDGSVSEKKSRYKSRREDSSQDRTDGGIRGGGQEQNHSRGATENLEEDEKNKSDSKP
jgi:hypothetical protein